MSLIFSVHCIFPSLCHPCLPFLVSYYLIPVPPTLIARGLRTTKGKYLAKSPSQPQTSFSFISNGRDFDCHNQQIARRFGAFGRRLVFSSRLTSDHRGGVPIQREIFCFGEHCRKRLFAPWYGYCHKKTIGFAIDQPQTRYQ